MKNKLILRFCILIATGIHFSTGTIAQNTGIGTPTPAGKFHIKGSANTSQLIIDANSTQSNTQPLIRLRKSTEVDLLHIYSDAPENTFVGLEAGKSNSYIYASQGIYNTFIGSKAGYSNTTGIYNTTLGSYALYYNTSGSANTAAGSFALQFNVSGINNTAFGSHALADNTASENTAVGSNSLFRNTTGTQNTAIGSGSMFNSIGGSWNTATGYFSMHNNTSGFSNAAFGQNTLYSNTIGDNNAAFGADALRLNTSGFENTALGSHTLYYNNSGVRNTANGAYALINSTGSSNTACGFAALSTNTTGGSNTAVGASAGSSLPNNVDNVTCIGYNAGFVTTLTNHINIGNTSVTWLGGQTGFFNYSDERIKGNIQENVPGLEFINRLRPVTYNLNIHRQNEMVYADKKGGPDWNGKYDIEQILQTGFVAQEVEKAANEISFSFNGIYKPSAANGLYSLNYSQFVVPLVKAVQELSSRNELLQKQLDEQKQFINELKIVLGKLTELQMKNSKTEMPVNQ